MSRPRWAVMFSGRGSNLAALLELREEIDLRLVISSDPKAYGLLRAKRSGVVSRLTPFLSGTRKIDWRALDLILRAHGINRIFLAGFMKIVPRDFVEKWRGQILNLHPSLLPSYPGLNSIERAIKDQADLGVTVHEVNEEVDAGQVVLMRRSLRGEEIRQFSLKVSSRDASERLEFLVHVDEQRVVKEVVRRWKTATLQ